MGIRRFNLETDFADVNGWYYERKGHFLPLKFLAKVGFIVPGVAVGFLMQTDTNIGILEPFVSNPQAPENDRGLALTAILESLVDEARHLNYRAVFGFSTSQSMLERAVNQDFEIIETNSTTVAKEL